MASVSGWRRLGQNRAPSTCVTDVKALPVLEYNVPKYPVTGRERITIPDSGSHRIHGVEEEGLVYLPFPLPREGPRCSSSSSSSEEDPQNQTPEKVERQPNRKKAMIDARDPTTLILCFSVATLAGWNVHCKSHALITKRRHIELSIGHAVAVGVYISLRVPRITAVIFNYYTRTSRGATVYSPHIAKIIGRMHCHTHKSHEERVAQNAASASSATTAYWTPEGAMFRRRSFSSATAMTRNKTVEAEAEAKRVWDPDGQFAPFNDRPFQPFMPPTALDQCGHLDQRLGQILPTHKNLQPEERMLSWSKMACSVAKNNGRGAVRSIVLVAVETTGEPLFQPVASRKLDLRLSHRGPYSAVSGFSHTFECKVAICKPCDSSNLSGSRPEKRAGREYGYRRVDESATGKGSRRLFRLPAVAGALSLLKRPTETVQDASQWAAAYLRYLMFWIGLATGGRMAAFARRQLSLKAAKPDVCMAFPRTGDQVSSAEEISYCPSLFVRIP
ncbi:uncharacterized protein CLUP02_00919 [Colletotrichum lupini]|uniref:Uncharacterized protein n=1 Tax=Colletotrichum lupini TaxID=145971 RepID=A0A9Q8W8T0_9PEZI|nr:uncharacterized protein CLUP02_00919 [Colletotrichum lupini]UQC74271.1 hypothetical protein CLUP02_00919 [Colletotrichum lupini]